MKMQMQMHMQILVARRGILVVRRVIIWLCKPCKSWLLFLLRTTCLTICLNIYLFSYPTAASLLLKALSKLQLGD